VPAAPGKIAALAALAALACTWPAAGERSCAPEEIDTGTLVRIDRTAEAERALELDQALAAFGLADPVAAIYEFDFIRDKPVFYFVAGRGRAEPRAILDDVLRRFGGRVRDGVEPRERSTAGASFLCVPFDRGRGMVAISGGCAFADERFSGYVVRTDGGDDDDALQYGAEARQFHRERAGATAACPDHAKVVRRAAPPGDRDAVAREIVAAVRGWDCHRLAPLAPAGTPAFFEERVGRDIRDPQHSAIEQVCFALGTLEYPRSERMRIGVEWEREGSVRLSLRGGLLDRPAPLHLVREGEVWRLDRDWALRVTQDLWTRRALMGAASTLQSYVLRTKRFGDDPKEVIRRTSIVADFAPGMAGATSPPDRLHVLISPGGETACVSARSRSGAILVVREEKSGEMSYGRFETPPADCPAHELDGRWVG
jgi:hypothetical protein